MRKLALLPLFALLVSCNDGTVFEPMQDLSPTLTVTQDALGMVPLKGKGLWEWDTGIRAPGADCTAAGGMAEVHFTGRMNLTHLGLTRNLIVQCLDFSATPIQVFTVETLEAANGDRLVIYEDTPLDPLPPGADWGYEYVVVDGTGRFDGATGYGIAYGTLQPTPTGLRGEEFIVGTVSSVGSSR